MKIIEQKFEILDKINPSEIMRKIELCGRVCYKSEGKITPESAEIFIAGIIKRGHESVLEHASFSVRFITDRGVSHEIIRHRIASYSQESTRYCKYGDDNMTFIKPYFADDKDKYNLWYSAMEQAEKNYNLLLEVGAIPEAARSILPNSLKTEIIMTANLREWRHFIKLRADKAAHPQLRSLTRDFANELNKKLPVIFTEKY